MIQDLKATYLRALNYLASTLDEDEVFAWIAKETPVRGLPEWQIAAEQGRLMRLLAQTIGARRILEVGTLGGYSGLWLARALPPRRQAHHPRDRPKGRRLGARGVPARGRCRPR